MPTTPARTAFVTGATGFLGTTLVEELSAAGWTIHCLRRKGSDVAAIAGLPGVRLELGDILDRASIERAMPAGVDAVFHAAGSVENLPHARERERYAINQGGTRTLVEVALARGAGRFIHTSTVLTRAFRKGVRVDESSPANPTTTDHYIRSKLLAEEEVLAGGGRGLDAVILHPSAIFGAHDKATWSRMFSEVHRGVWIPFMPPGELSASHMRKVALAHLAAFHRGRRGERYVLGGPDVTLLDVVSEVGRVLGRPTPRWRAPAWLFRLAAAADRLRCALRGAESPLNPHTTDTLCYHCLSDSSKAVRELGYDPSSLAEMLADCHRWMVATGRLPAPAHLAPCPAAAHAA